MMKVFSIGPSHMTKMATMPIYGKLKNLLLWNQKANDFETYMLRQVAEYYQVWWPWEDLDLYYDTVKFGPLCFRMGKSLNNGFFRNYCSLWYKNWYMQSTKLAHEALWVPKVQVIDWPWSNLSDSIFLNFFS